MKLKELQVAAENATKIEQFIDPVWVILIYAA
jgi:hypothetical protein